MPRPLDPFLRTDLLRFTTAGSVDDGKSTLIGRLLLDCRAVYEDHLAALAADSRRLNRETTDLALLTDGLKAEREQGITIDVAYRHFATPRRRFIIADTPGHEQYTRNMATGASTASLAVILVDARQGLLTQSRRHAFISVLLGIRHLVLAVNKMDLVDWSREVFDRLRSEFMTFANRLGIEDVVCIPMSALLGDNVVTLSPHMSWYEGKPLVTHLETVAAGAVDASLPLRFPVQSVLRPGNDFRGLAGQIASGRLCVGLKVLVQPAGLPATVRSIRLGESLLEDAQAPRSVAVELEEDLDVGRGALLSDPEHPAPVCDRVPAILLWMSASPMEARTWLARLATRLVRCTVEALDCRVNPDTLETEGPGTPTLNWIGRVTVRFHEPVPCDVYRENRTTGSFVLVDPLGNDTVAACMILPADGHVQGLSPLREVRTPARLITPEASLVSAQERFELLRQRPVTLWLTGLSGSGKSTIAKALERRLVDAGHACCVLDGDNVRRGLNRDLGFAPGDRTENIRRVAEVAALMNEAGLIVITAFISPYAEDRARAAQAVGADRFAEVYVDAPLPLCEARDPKGLYRKAREGTLPEFTGVSAPYESPTSPALRLDTSSLSVGECVDRVMAFLEAGGHLSVPAVGNR
ncbi:MAG: adenylyl-sulfate kinase [Deltaproteobacteria bacterium]|nr:adenylyl-sulfate kinase [Deltaproteobacteria bacterium]